MTITSLSGRLSALLAAATLSLLTVCVACTSPPPVEAPEKVKWEDVVLPVDESALYDNRLPETSRVGGAYWSVEDMCARPNQAWQANCIAACESVFAYWYPWCADEENPYVAE